MFRSADQSVLQHFGITGEEVMGIEAAQKFCFKEYAGGRSEDADFILQPVEVDTCLASYGSIYHSQQGSRDIDISNAPLKCRGGETTQVGHHATSQIDKQ